VKQSVTFGATFTIPTTGVPTATSSDDFNYAYYAYGTAIKVFTYVPGPPASLTINAGFTLAAGTSRRGTAVVFTTTTTTCASGTCNTPVASAANAAAVSTASSASSATVAAAIVSAAAAAGYTMTSPTVSAPVPQGGDSGKTAVVAVTAFAIAVIAMVM